MYLRKQVCNTILTVMSACEYNSIKPLTAPRAERTQVSRSE